MDLDVWGKPLYHSIVILAVVIALVCILSRKDLKRLPHRFLSHSIHLYLCWRYPIKTTDQKLSLPTCPYEWPNGQGDVGKFLEGIKNGDRWRDKHGGIYRIWSGMASEVVLTQPEDVRAVFKDSDRHIKAANNDAGWLMGELLGQCLGLVSQKRWQRIKVAMEHGFLHSQTKNYTEIVIRRTEKHIAELPLQYHAKERLLDPVRDLKMLPFWITADVLYGELSQEMELELKHLLPLREALFKRMIQGGLTRFSWSRYLAIDVNRMLTEFQSRWKAFNDKAHSRALDGTTNVPILRMYEALSQKELTQQELYQTLDEMLFANIDVTIGGISWSVLLLAAHEDVQEDVRKETLQALLSSQSEQAEWSRYLQSSSTLLMASILESSRLRPLAPFSVPQSAPTDRTVRDFVIPAKTNYIIDTYALNIHNPFWGEDRTSFKPSRFIGGKMTDTRYHFWRFGFGPRVCLGRHLADLIMKTLLTYLLRSYKLSFLGELGESAKISDMWITQPDIRIVCEKLS